MHAPLIESAPPTIKAIRALGILIVQNIESSMGDERTYDYACLLRAVTTTDFMTAEAAELPWSLINKVTNRIVNEVKGISRVFYDCTGKPPSTIELE